MNVRSPCYSCIKENTSGSGVFKSLAIDPEHEDARLPGEGMRLELNLQGGIHLILKVNLPRTVENQLGSLVTDQKEILWLPFLLAALFVVMLLFAVAPPHPLRTRRQAIERTTLEMASERSLGVFFWILVIGLGTVIIIHYLGQVPWLRTVFYNTSSNGSEY